MDDYKLKIDSIKKITRDVLSIKTTKPSSYSYSPGQATEVAINKKGWQDKKRAFTFTSLPKDNFLEFTIKTYPDHNGVTNQLLNLTPTDELLIGDSWGTIGYKGEGTFIAGGAGVTPFISILRYLNSKNEIGTNKLLFANKTTADIIHKEEFEAMLGKNFINILSDEKKKSYAHGFITEEFLKANILDVSKHIYVCGPQPMMDAIEKQLLNLSVDKNLIIKEEF